MRGHVKSGHEKKSSLFSCQTTILMTGGNPPNNTKPYPLPLHSSLPQIPCMCKLLRNFQSSFLSIDLIQTGYRISTYLHLAENAGI